MNERADQREAEEEDGPNYLGVGIMASSLALLAFGHFAAIQPLFLCSAAVVISLIIWQVCDPFADAAQWIGVTFRLPGSVRGATLDAIASSMPELFSGIFFVWVAISGVENAQVQHEASAEGFGATLATCAGSAVYNMILIPAVCAIAISFWRKERPTIDVEKEVILRDGLWFMGCELILLAFLWSNQIHWWMGVVLMAAYFAYILHLYRDARAYRQAKELDEEDDELPESAAVFFGVFEIPLNSATAWLTILLSTVLAAAACYFLVDITNQTAELLEVPSFFVAVILAAAVSSVPDTFLSLGAATRGDDSGAVSNAFGSNIFDICICLSVPLLVGTYMNGWQPISLTEINEAGQEVAMAGLVGLRILLWVLTLVTLLILWHKQQLTRRKAFVLCGLYLVFVGYAVLGSLGIMKL